MKQQATAQRETVQRETAQRETAQRETVQRETAQRETAQKETAQKETAKREGLGFIVENLFEAEISKNDDKEYDDKEYDDIKMRIIDLYKKINQRKYYGNGVNNNKNENAFVYINHSKIREQYRELLKILYNETNETENCTSKQQRAKWHAVMMYRLIAYTRDISEGCGERELAYMQLFEWARVDATLASHALSKFVTPAMHDDDNDSAENKKTVPLGSWKDVKGLVAHMRRTMNMRDDRDMAAYLALTNFSISMVNGRLAKDVLAFYKDDNDNDNDNDNDKSEGNGDSSDNQMSFVSKWIPRENKSKKYGNFYERLACDYYKTWIPKDRCANPVSYEKAVVKCKIHYRKLISFLNQYLETPQIKMCERNWSEINFSKTTRQTRDLQDSAFQNVKSDDYRCKRHYNDADRDKCAEKYKVWKCDMLNYRNGIKTDLETHVRVAEYYSGCSLLAANRNAEWSAFSSQQQLADNLQRVIPVLAGSSYKAVGLALATAENALTGRTLILGSNAESKELTPHKLDDDSFVKNVNAIFRIQRQKNATQNENVIDSHLPLYSCLTSVLKLLIESNVTAKQTKDAQSPFTIMIFTDDETSSFFNMGDCDACFKEAWNEASLLYNEFGYAVPKIVLWAMKSTVQHEDRITRITHETRNNASAFAFNHEVCYSSTSNGGALKIRVGCTPNDICSFLGIDDNNDNNNNNNKQKRMKEFINQSDQNKNKWTNEWNELVENLYNARYYEFEQYFWKNRV